MRKTKSDWQQRIARERIQILFNLAEKELLKNPERSRRYVGLARKIGLRYNVRFSKALKERFCKKCSSLLVPKKTCEISTDKRRKMIEIKCKNCNQIHRRILE